MRAPREAHYSVYEFAAMELAFDHLADAIRDRQAMIVTTPGVHRLYGDALERRLRERGVTPQIRILPCTEGTKSLDLVTQVCEWAAEERMERNGLFVPMGGGVLTDIVTMAASWIRRGVGQIRIPTTLIGQVDAAIGIKGGVNFQAKKGFLGCFYPPEEVLIAPGFLKTLPARHLRCGLAEMVKIAIVADPALFHDLEVHGERLLASCFQTPEDAAIRTIRAAAARMLELLSTNLYERDTFEREVDYGHTFSQTIETESRFQIAHGEAVAMDVALSAVLSRELGLHAPDTCQAILDLQLKLGLDCYDRILTPELCRHAMIDAARHRGGSVNLVLPTQLGGVRFIKDAAEIPDAVLERALESLAKSPIASRSTLNGAVKSLGFHSAPETDSACCLVLDIGGTSIRSGVYLRGENAVADVVSLATPNHLRWPGEELFALKERLFDAVGTASIETLRGREPDIVSVAFAGPMNGDGMVLAAPTVWGPAQREPVDLRSAFQAIWPRAEVVLLNDVAAAGYRFLRSTREDLCVITVGSGIGNKTFIGGRPVTGAQGRGGEIGHIQVDDSPDAVVCECGGRGHLGAIASGRGALRMAQRIATQTPDAFAASLPGRQCGGNAEALTTEQLVEGFHAGDIWSHEVIRTVARPLGRVIASIHLDVGVERFVIFGGFGLALGEGYRQLLVEAAAALSWNVGQCWDRMIELGAEDGNSGLIGAGRAVSFLRS
jgi:3-dehydroquinate synthetase/predicted NBD/HSP70 family sugar kinase